jgi:Tol biopolymer transport system component
MGPVFSPDGSRIAYTTVGGQFVWNTWIVPVSGGTARLWLANASGLSWIAPQKVLFSQITAGLHMSVVEADENRAAIRTIYAPQHPLGMAHRSSLSPDGKSILIVEMENPVWQQCRLVPLDGQSRGRRVGPAGQCTSAAWSRDGTTMYFSSNASGSFHIWRQRFPNGSPEPMTGGTTEEEGIAIAPDGGSLLTSIGDRESSIWTHDGRGQHAVSREGYAFVPTLPNGLSQPFSADGHVLFYLVRQGAVQFSGPDERAGELWMTELETERSEALLPGFKVISYDVSRDGKRVVFAALDDHGASHIWLAQPDRRSPARQLSALEADSPRFGAGHDIFCRGKDGGASFIYRIQEDGSSAEKAVKQPVLYFLSASPDGAWLAARVPATAREPSRQTNLAFPAAGGSPVAMCDACEIDWTPDGKSLIVRRSADQESTVRSAARTFVIALPPNETLPHLPANGIRSEADLAALPVVQTVDGFAYPGARAPMYAFNRGTIHRNIYRVPF